MPSLTSWRRLIISAVAVAILAVALPVVLDCFVFDTPLTWPAGIPGDEHTQRLSASIAQQIPNVVFNASHEAYKMSVLSYFSAQNREHFPHVVVCPRSAKELSAIVTLIKQDYDASLAADIPPVSFAIRSGGHMPSAGAANSYAGITIDLRNLNTVEPAADLQTVSIGAGARWLDVSRVLDPLGVVVAGGRDSEVGVGGYVLGGGISYFSPRLGFVCDQIVRFELVLANGSLVEAAQDQHADLWRALKGGSNNFGIVTRVVSRAYPGTELWGGYVFYLPWKFEQVIRAFYDFVQPERYDEDSAFPLTTLGYTSFGFRGSLGFKIIGSNLVYTKPIPWPATWAGYRAIGHIKGDLKLRSVTALTQYMTSLSSAGARQLFRTTTITLDLDTLRRINQINNEAIAKVSRVTGLVWALPLQPLPPSMTVKGDVNSLGLQDRNETIVVVLINASWRLRKDDELVQETARELIGNIEEYARSRGTLDRFRYLNYAAADQDPISGYGDEVKKFMQITSHAYDPDGLFQRACTGGFKLGLDVK